MDDPSFARETLLTADKDDPGEAPASEPSEEKKPSSGGASTSSSESTEKADSDEESRDPPEKPADRESSPPPERTEDAIPEKAADAIPEKTADAIDEDDAHPGILVPLVLGGLAVALTETFRAGYAGIHNGGGVRSMTFAGLATFGIVAAPFMLGAALIGLVLRRPEVRSLGRSVTAAFAGEDELAHKPLGALAGAALIGGAASAASQNGRGVATTSSANVAVSVTVGTLLAILIVGGPLLAIVVRTLGSRLMRAAKKRAWVGQATSGPVMLVVAAVSISIALRGLVPRGFWLPLGVGIGVFCVVVMPRWKTRVENALTKKRWMMMFAPAIALGIVTPLVIDHAPAVARQAMLYRAPLSSSMIHSARSYFDHDHDTYSPYMLGGDCDDNNAGIHPGAKDIPNNGIDENCSGADAKTFVPYKQAPFTMPEGLLKKPNIVMIQFDALRPDHLHFNGYARNTSPNLDKFRETATLFTHAYTPAPSTRFALAALFTGLDVEAIPQHRGPGNDLELLPGAPTLAERFGTLNYDRVGYTISFVIQHAPGIGRGFRSFQTPWPLDQWLANYPVMATKTTDATIDFLKGVSDDGTTPFVIFVHYACTHDPYGKKDRWDYGSSSMDEYDSAINYCDDEFARLVAALDARKDHNKTDMFVFSDHGELFDEHGFSYHGNALYEAEVRIMMMVRIPGLQNPQKTVDMPISLTDVHATALSVAELSPERNSPAWNLLPYMMSGERPGDKDRPIFLYTQLNSEGIKYDSRGVVKGDYKFIRDITAGTTELYDIANDKNEADDLSQSNRKKRDELAELVDSWETGEPPANRPERTPLRK